VVIEHPHCGGAAESALWRLMAPQAAQFDLSTSFLDIPKRWPTASCAVREFDSSTEQPDKSRISFYMLARVDGFASSLVDQQ